MLFSMRYLSVLGHPLSTEITGYELFRQITVKDLRLEMSPTNAKEF
jgi:hypothetical protein